MVDRREALRTLLFGASMIGLRALATGLPAGFLINPGRALATDALGCAANDKAQYIIFNTSAAGDPLNANVPGTYDDPNITHSSDPSMAPSALMLEGLRYIAALPWTTLSPDVLARTSFFHLMTNTPIHPKEPEVLKLMGRTNAGEMLPSLLAKQLATCLGTIQTQPISLGATSPAEALSFGGMAQPIVPALALKATLTNPAGPLTDLQPLRDQTLNQIYDLYRTQATPAQRKYIDAWVNTQQQLRNLNQNLLGALSSIKDNSPASQVLAAIALIQMKVTPVVAIHIPFGGDNHRDIGLALEAKQTVAGVATIAGLMDQLAGVGLSDSVSFVSLNVFGRTIGPGNTDGRQHNGDHQVSLMIGKPFRGSVIGGVGPLKNDYGALAIDSATGVGSVSGDISPIESLASFGRTVLAAMGVEASAIDAQISGGKIVSAALA